MKKYLTLILLSVFTSACVDKELLDINTEDANFTETGFYQSGDFETDADIRVVNMDVTTNGNGYCSPTITFTLEDDYSQNLNANWDENIQILIQKAFEDNDFIYELEPPFNQEFVLSNVTVACGSNLNIKVTVGIKAKDKSVVGTTTSFNKAIFIQ